MKQYIKKRIKNQLRIHWYWLKKRDSEAVANYVIAIIENDEKTEELVSLMYVYLKIQKRIGSIAQWLRALVLQTRGE